jgi:hypothetical protein
VWQRASSVGAMRKPLRRGVLCAAPDGTPVHQRMERPCAVLLGKEEVRLALNRPVHQLWHGPAAPALRGARGVPTPMQPSAEEPSLASITVSFVCLDLGCVC